MSSLLVLFLNLKTFLNIFFKNLIKSSNSSNFDFSLNEVNTEKTREPEKKYLPIKKIE